MPDRDQLIVENLALARWHASQKRYRAISPAVSHDDLYQAACVGLVKAADTWAPEKSPFDYWAGRKIQAEIVGELRRMRCRFRRGHGIEPELEIQWQPLDDGVAHELVEPHADLADDVEVRLARLPGRTRTMLRLRFGLDDGEEWQDKRIAAAMGCSITKVFTHLHRALRLLRTG